MIFSSWNCRGLASKPKKLALKDWLLNSKAEVLLLQETLGKGLEVEIALKSLLPRWSFIAIDSTGHSGGIAIGFKEGKLKIINQWGTKHVLGLEVLSSDFPFPFSIVNVYGPCQGREVFWEDLMAKSFMKYPLLIVGGDLNFSIGRAEAWGPSAREDPLSDFFQNLMLESNLSDPSPVKLNPT